MSNFELLAAMQACMIYFVVYIVDYSPEVEVDARELLVALNASPIIYCCLSLSVTNLCRTSMFCSKR